MRCLEEDSHLDGETSSSRIELALSRLIFGKRDLLFLDQLLQFSDPSLRLLEFEAKKSGATERFWPTHSAGELCGTRFLP
jgi:hypothetical protein